MSLFVQVLQQEHLERARQNPTSATVRENVDNATFFQNLPPDLRRAILSDMDDSLISHLPEEMRSEAQTLRQDRDSRRRHMLEQRHAFLERMMEEAHMRSGHMMEQRHAFQERMLEEAHIRSSQAVGDSAIIPPTSWPQLTAQGMRYAVVNLNPHMLDGHVLSSAQAGGAGYLGRGGPLGHGGRVVDQSSKQMLDQEALTCLLVLLFLDQSKLHNNRLHRIIKNLSQHSPTRAWILSSLLAIIKEMRKAPSVQVTPLISSTCPMPPPLTAGHAGASGSDVGVAPGSDVGVASGSSSTPVIVSPHHYTLPHWLDISINAALGSHAKIFQLEGESAGKGTAGGSKVNIHPLAGTTISHNVLDVLIFLARHFGASFLPPDLMPKVAEEKKDDGSDVVSNFWQILLRLDGAVGRKGKGTMKGFKFLENKGLLTEQELFSSSIIGQLMALFTHDIIGENIALTDKLLRLLSVASSSIPRTGMRSLTTEFLLKNLTPIISPVGNQVSATTGESVGITAGKNSRGELEDVFDYTVRLSIVAPPLLSSVIAVLTSGKCSEEGLEEATTLLTNLSKCSIPTREQILYMLLNGVRTIGRTLCSQIIALDDSVNAKLHEETLEKEQLQYQQDGGKKKKKAAPAVSGAGVGVLSGVVLSGVEEYHIDHSHDLHIPTMAPLTCKGSQQSFFVRMLKVVCQLRESAQLAINAAAAAKNNAAASLQQSPAAQTQADTADGTPASAEGTQTNAEGTVANSEVTQTVPGSSSLQNQNETQEQSGSQSKADSAVHSVVEHKAVFLQMLSQQLELEELWCILSNCLDALSHTEDPHAVFVLQPTVEAFFLVHANYKDDGQKGKKKTSQASGSRFSRLSSSSHMLDSESNPASPSPFSPLPGTPGLGENDVDPFAHLPPDTAKFLKFAGKPPSLPPSHTSQHQHNL